MTDIMDLSGPRPATPAATVTNAPNRPGPPVAELVVWCSECGAWTPIRPGTERGSTPTWYCTSCPQPVLRHIAGGRTCSHNRPTAYCPDDACHAAEAEVTP